jgi:hypothetical protein
MIRKEALKESLSQGGVMDKVRKKVLTMISAFVLAMSFLCYGTDANAHNKVTILVSGDSKKKSEEAFNALYRHLLGGYGVRMGKDYTCLSGLLNMDNVSAELSATVDMYHVNDLKTIPELWFPSDLLVLVYAGEKAEGLGNLPQLQKELKRRKHRIELPEMVLLRLNEVLPSSYDDENPGVKLVKACGKLWPLCPVKEKDNGPNADGCEN